MPDTRLCIHCNKTLAFHTGLKAQCPQPNVAVFGPSHFASIEPEPPRDWYAEACLIARGKSQMLAQREHIVALYTQIEREFDQRERDADYIHDGEFYNNEREPEEDGRDWL